MSYIEKQVGSIALAATRFPRGDAEPPWLRLRRSLAFPLHRAGVE